MTILADGSQGSPSLGEIARRAVNVPARAMIGVGKNMEDNAYQGEVAQDALDRQTGRWYVKFPWSTPLPLPKVTDAWGAANGIIGGIGRGLHGAGSGLLAVTGNVRPLAENVTSRSINKYAPLHGQSLVDDLVEHNIKKTYGPDRDSQPLW